MQCTIKVVVGDTRAVAPDASEAERGKERRGPRFQNLAKAGAGTTAAPNSSSDGRPMRYVRGAHVEPGTTGVPASWESMQIHAITVLSKKPQNTPTKWSIPGEFQPISTPRAVARTHLVGLLENAAAVPPQNAPSATSSECMHPFGTRTRSTMRAALLDASG